MNVTRLMPLIYPFIRYFVQKRLSGGKLPFRGKTAIRGKTTTPTPSAPEAAGVLNFSLRSSAEYSTTQYSVMLLEVFRDWK